MKRTMTFALTAVTVLSLCLCSPLVRDGLADIMSTLGDEILNCKKLTFTPSRNIGTAGTGFIQITSTNADTTVQGYLIKGTYTDDGDADADFLIFEDNEGDAKFLIAEDGNTNIAGLLTAAGGIDTVGATTDITLKNDATIVNTSADLLTITEPTITLAGSTKLNLDGPTDVTGVLTVDTAGSPVDGIKISATTPTDGLEISSVCGTNAINISGANTGHAIGISGTWGQGITGAAISIGDYSNAVAFGTSTDHVLGIVSHIGVALGADDNVIPILGKVTLSGDCSTSTVAQAVLGMGVCNYNILDMYGVRGSIAITDTPEVNQIYGVNSTMTTTECNMAATGMIALYGGVISGTEDITKTSGYAAVCGMYLSWAEQNAMTVDTNGVLVNVAASSQIDNGMVVHLDGAGTSVGTSFKSYRDGGTITTGYAVEGAHTNAFAFPAEATAPVAAHIANDESTGRIKITVGGADRYIYYYD